MENINMGMAKLAEIRECVDMIALDGSKFFDKGMFFNPIIAFFIILFVPFICTNQHV